MPPAWRDWTSPRVPGCSSRSGLRATVHRGAAVPGAAGIAADAVEVLIRAGVRLVGLEDPSADPAGSADFPAHRALLGAGVIIVEGLDLSAVPPGPYELLCLPLKLRAGDGAPARVVLRAWD